MPVVVPAMIVVAVVSRLDHRVLAQPAAGEHEGVGAELAVHQVVVLAALDRVVAAHGLVQQLDAHDVVRVEVAVVVVPVVMVVVDGGGDGRGARGRPSRPRRRRPARAAWRVVHQQARVVAEQQVVALAAGDPVVAVAADDHVRALADGDGVGLEHAVAGACTGSVETTSYIWPWNQLIVPLSPTTRSLSKSPPILPAAWSITARAVGAGDDLDARDRRPAVGVAP